MERGEFEALVATMERFATERPAAYTRHVLAWGALGYAFLFAVLVVLFVLGGLQGAGGWWMVQSGLETRVSVSQYRLAIHLGVAIIIEAALGFLGVGIPPPTPSWGEMLRTGKSYLYEAPYYAVLPGIVLTLTILSLDTIGRTLAWALEERHEEVEDDAEKGTAA